MNPLEILVYATPVSLAALGETVSQKAGVINIGLEGMMLTGAFVALLATQASGSPVVGLAVGALAAVALAAFQALFTLALALDQVVIGTAINLFALGVTSTVYRAQFGQSGSLMSLPSTIPGWSGVLLVLLLAPLIVWLLNRTRLGLALRAAGEYPNAVEASQFSVLRLRWWAVLFGGLLAGLAGAFLTVGVNGNFTEAGTNGRGFVAIALVTFGRWNAWGVLAASALIGVLEWSQFRLQAMGVQVPSPALIALPYVVSLGVLAFAGGGRLAPAHLAVPFTRR